MKSPLRAENLKESGFSESVSTQSPVANHSPGAGAAEAIAWAQGRSPEKLAAEGAQISSMLAQLAVEARKIGEEAGDV